MRHAHRITLAFTNELEKTVSAWMEHDHEAGDRSHAHSIKAFPVTSKDFTEEEVLGIERLEPGS